MSRLDKRQKVSLTVLIVFIVASGLIAWFAGEPLIRFVKNPAELRAWVDQNGFLSRLGFIGIVIVQLVVAVIPGEPVEFAAGYAFGALNGAIVCLIGQIIGGALVFLLVRKYGVKLLEAFFPVEKINEMRFLRDSKRLNLLLFVLFFIPGTPKDIITYVAPLTKVSLGEFLLISNIARIPSVVTSSIAGGAAGSEDYRATIVVYAITAVVSLIGIWIYRRIQKAEHSGEESAQ